jgi:hypothetical protein
LQPAASQSINHRDVDRPADCRRALAIMPRAVEDIVYCAHRVELGVNRANWFSKNTPLTPL